MPAFPFKPHGLIAPVLLCSVLLPATALGLTLAEAEQRALARNPALNASEAAADAADGDARQAGLLPNPEVSFSRENMGNDQLTGLDGPASTWQLSQKLELTGQRGARRDSAVGDAEAARSRLLRERELLRAEVRTAWVEVLAAQQRVAFAEELGQVTRDTREAVAAQVKAGKVSPIELTRVEVAAASLQRREQTAKLSLVAARQRLANLQGLARPDFGALPDNVPATKPLPPEEAARQRVQANPLIKETEARAKASEASLRAARANRFPGITVSVGQTQFEDAGQSAWQMGVSVPLPLFDRNQGATQAAEARLREARAQADVATQGLQGELDVLYPQVQTLGQQLETFQQSVLPASEQAFSAVNKGYRFGKFGLLDVLDAQRALIDTRFDYLDTLTEYHRQRNRLDALLGLTQENSL
jgi:cobalt-zinc-cadmium efflux system outer membrane protein